MKTTYTKWFCKLSVFVFTLTMLSASAYGEFCTPGYSTGTSDNDYINGVTLEGIVNTGSGGAITGTGYSDYTYLSADLAAGNTYTLYLDNTPNWGEYYIAWIDYNQDEEFSTEEQLNATSLYLSAGASGSIVFTVPNSASTGETRMRVRCVYGTTSFDACTSYIYGEAEDYTINILPGFENNLAVVAMSSPTSGADIGYQDVTITIANYGTADASGFNVYYNVDGGVWTGFIFDENIPAGGTADYTFGEGWTFTEYGCFDVMAWVDYDADEFPDDDSFTKTVCNLGPVTGTGAHMVISNVYGGYEPWYVTSNTDAMNSVFGAGEWTLDFYETVDPGVLFSSENCFVYLEGGDAHANEMETFLNANMETIESWVVAGGRLLLNSAPNEGDGMSFGFDGTSLVYSYYTSTAEAATSHPIFDGPFTPVGTSWTGGSFGHARITGSDLNVLIVDAFATDNIVLAEKVYGAGVVLFGGMTPNFFHSPATESANLRANILSYLSCGAVVEACNPVPPTGIYVDGISATSATVHFSPATLSDGTRGVLYNLSTGTLRKFTVGAESTAYTLPAVLTPSTTYGVRLKTVCLDAGVLSDYSAWYYFTTAPLRAGEFVKEVTVYPNPNDGNFRIQLNGYAQSDAEIMILNSVGQTVYNANY
ncbi:MAG: GEVED domain-containing protein, partial [Chitinophagales bacterium]